MAVTSGEMAAYSVTIWWSGEMTDNRAGGFARMLTRLCDVMLKLGTWLGSGRTW